MRNTGLAEHLEALYQLACLKTIRQVRLNILMECRRLARPIRLHHNVFGTGRGPLKVNLNDFARKPILKSLVPLLRQLS